MITYMHACLTEFTCHIYNEIEEEEKKTGIIIFALKAIRDIDEIHSFSFFLITIVG